MDLESGRPFWPVQNGLIRNYPRLRGSIKTDVLIVGAGITGAIIADELTRHGFRVAVVDRRDVGGGSTAASTALLQYEMDSSLQQLEQWYGPEIARGLYHSGVQAINVLKAICGQLPDSGGFQARPSWYLASSPEDVDELQREYALRQAAGLPVEYRDETAIRSSFDFIAPGALYTSVAGEVDPYRLTHALLHRVTSSGGQVFDRCAVHEWETAHGLVRFETEGGEITARCAVIAAGFESEAFLPQAVASLRSTYAFVSEPLTAFPGWPERSLLWETARPYLYLRTTTEGRILAGGEDSLFRNSPLRDRVLKTKVAQIEARVRGMFPRIDFAIDYAWAGTFAETKDGLPFIGPHPDRPGLLFALCYGGNGITYSMLAAATLRAHLEGDSHPLASAVAFERHPLKARDGE